MNDEAGESTISTQRNGFRPSGSAHVSQATGVSRKEELARDPETVKSNRNYGKSVDFTRTERLIEHNPSIRLTGSSLSGRRDQVEPFVERV
jgi:hypothetical protein